MLDTFNAKRLALLFLRANSSADSWQRIRGTQRIGGILNAAVAQFAQKLGNINIDRTTRDALGILAIETAAGFRDCLLLRVAQRDFLKSLDALLRIAFRHRDARRMHLQITLLFWHGESSH